MKKQLLLAIVALTGGLVLPAAAQYGGRHHTPHVTPHVEIFINGYRSCGTPVYAKRVHYGHFVRIEPLTACELRSYLLRRQRIVHQRVHPIRVIPGGHHRSPYQQRGRSYRRCR